jgi:beta-aspartyl-peptidase (threonine type)
LQKAIAQERLLQDHDVIPDMPEPDANEKTDEKRGTVGAVALDRQGDLAAGASTDGIRTSASDVWGTRPLLAPEPTPTTARLRYQRLAPEKYSSAL